MNLMKMLQVIIKISKQRCYIHRKICKQLYRLSRVLRKIVRRAGMLFIIQMAIKRLEYLQPLIKIIYILLIFIWAPHQSKLESFLIQVLSIQQQLVIYAQIVKENLINYLNHHLKLFYQMKLRQLFMDQQNLKVRKPKIKLVLLKIQIV